MKIKHEMTNYQKAKRDLTQQSQKSPSNQSEIQNKVP